MLPRSLPVLHAFFAVSVLCTFTAHKKLNRHSRLHWPALVVRADAFFSLPPSVEQLRAKSGKTMVALSVAGHSRFLQQGKGQVRSDSRVKI